MNYKNLLVFVIGFLLSGYQTYALINNAPVFSSTNYSSNISENAVLGSLAATVYASDLEDDPLVFTIRSGNVNGAFAISPEGGFLAVAKRLNHHTQNKFTLIIRATDTEGLFSEASVVINVTDAFNATGFDSITWSQAAKQPYTVSESQGEVVNGKLYTFGGFDAKKTTFTPTSRAYVFDPIANTWTSIAPMPPMNGTAYGGVTHAGFTTDGTDIYFAGGYTSNANGTGQKFGTKEVWKYIVAENRYVRLPDLPIVISAGQLEYLSGRLHHISGNNAARTIDLGDQYVLNLDSLNVGWKTLAPLPNPRQHSGSVVFENKIYYIGGQKGHDEHLVTQKDVHCYDPVTNSWTKVADLPVPAGVNGRGHISSSAIVFGKYIMVLGGETVHGSGRTNMVSAYTPSTNTWKNVTPLPQNRYSGVAANLNGVIYYTGGSTSSLTFKGIVSTNSTQQDTLLPHADAFIRNGTYANTNYGRDTSLVVKATTLAGAARSSYLKFLLPEMNGFKTAKLRVYGSNIGDNETVSLFVYGVENDSWGETTITWNNAPPAQTNSLSSAAVNTQKYYDFDVTSFIAGRVAGDNLVSFLIKDPANTIKFFRFNSKENRLNRPQLIIEYESLNPGAMAKTVQSGNRLTESINAHVKVYPNPVYKRFNVQFPKDYKGIYSIQMIDIAGRTYNMGKSRLQAGAYNQEIDISNLSLKPGNYLLRISNTTQTDVIKLIIP
jgi:N-acetylneuraminic acid mutarotase